MVGEMKYRIAAVGHLESVVCVALPDRNLKKRKFVRIRLARSHSPNPASQDTRQKYCVLTTIQVAYNPYISIVYNKKITEKCATYSLHTEVPNGHPLQLYMMNVSIPHWKYHSTIVVLSTSLVQFYKTLLPF
jgi:hypothetical protein